jgi:aminoglycoside phosphotransferase (APT) family kinase protein
MVGSGVSLEHDLPAGVVEWAAEVARGDVTRVERHVARREAWVVDVTRPDGSELEGFLRIDREPVADDPWSLRKEAHIVRALAETPVPVPALHGWNDELCCALFERVRGRSDLPSVGAAQQRAVMEHFMRVVADLHTLDLAALDLPPMPVPRTAEECALGEVDLILSRFSGFLAGHVDPLLTYAVGWLRRHAPREVARVSLVQGDTGPVNFMFDGDRVTAVVDWEWGHLGDPMEDLGNICVREFWNPSGGLAGLFPLYERHSGIPVDLDAVRYYRVQQNVRGMVPIAAASVNAHPREPVAWYLAYRYVGDRATCEALTEASGIEVESPELAEDDDSPDALATAADWALDHDIAPATADPFARSRIADVRVLVGCIERVRRHAATLHSVERDELGGLLGRTPATVDEGLVELDRAIREHRVDDERALSYLTRRARRAEWLYAPAAALYPDRAWAPIEDDQAPAVQHPARPLGD